MGRAIDRSRSSPFLFHHYHFVSLRARIPGAASLLVASLASSRGSVAPQAKKVSLGRRAEKSACARRERRTAAEQRAIERDGGRTVDEQDEENENGGEGLQGPPISTVFFKKRIKNKIRKRGAGWEYFKK
jgi:hypothetical protein